MNVFHSNIHAIYCLLRRKNAILSLFASLSVSLSSCWPTSISFNDTGSLHACLTHFEMDPLESSASNSPINYATELTEAVKSGVQNNTRLLLSSTQKTPQVIISGTITNYSLMPIALQEGDNAAQNRLTVSATFSIFFECPQDDYSHQMKVSSSRFADFDASQDISSIEAALTQEINEQIVQDVINQLLSNW